MKDEVLMAVVVQQITDLTNRVETIAQHVAMLGQRVSQMEEEK